MKTKKRQPVTKKPTHDTSKKTYRAKAQNKYCSKEIGMGARECSDFQPGCRVNHPNNAQHDHSFMAFASLMDGVIRLCSWKLAGKINGSLAGNISGDHFDWFYLFPHLELLIRPLRSRDIISQIVKP